MPEHGKYWTLASSIAAIALNHTDRARLLLQHAAPDGVTLAVFRLRNSARRHAVEVGSARQHTGPRSIGKHRRQDQRKSNRSRSKQQSDVQGTGPARRIRSLFLFLDSLP